MRKTVKLARVLVLAVLLFALSCLVATAPVVSFAEEPTPTDNEIATFVEELCAYNAADDKAGARDYLERQFKSVVGESNVERLMAGTTEYHNIEATLRGKDTSKQIVIGAHYDATGEGAGDNATGVAALYQTLKKFAATSAQLPFNIVFVAFDGEEEALSGSSYYVKNDLDVNSTLVMFNIDSIAHGTNLYLMCENKSTSLAKLILSKSDAITEKPYARGTYGSLDAFGYGYYEFIQGSDHTPFRLAGVPIAFFFSGNYSLASWNFDYGSVINTSSDTFANLPSGYISRIQTISDAIVDTVLSNEFVDVASNARSQLVNLDFWYNPWWPRIVALGILLILVVVTVLYSRKLQKNAILGTAEIKSNNVFTKPDAEEIFTFKGKDEQSSNIDDIFTFKK